MLTDSKSFLIITNTAKMNRQSNILEEPTGSRPTQLPEVSFGHKLHILETFYRNGAAEEKSESSKSSCESQTSIQQPGNILPMLLWWNSCCRFQWHHKRLYYLKPDYFHMFKEKLTVCVCVKTSLTAAVVVKAKWKQSMHKDNINVWISARTQIEKLVG